MRMDFPYLRFLNGRPFEYQNKFPVMYTPHFLTIQPGSILSIQNYNEIKRYFTEFFAKQDTKQSIMGYYLDTCTLSVSNHGVTLDEEMQNAVRNLKNPLEDMNEYSKRIMIGHRIERFYKSLTTKHSFEKMTFDYMTVGDGDGRLMNILFSGQFELFGRDTSFYRTFLLRNYSYMTTEREVGSNVPIQVPHTQIKIIAEHLHVTNGLMPAAVPATIDMLNNINEISSQLKKEDPELIYMIGKPVGHNVEMTKSMLGTYHFVKINGKYNDAETLEMCKKVKYNLGEFMQQKFEESVQIDEHKKPTGVTPEQGQLLFWAYLEQQNGQLPHQQQLLNGQELLQQQKFCPQTAFFQQRQQSNTQSTQTTLNNTSLMEVE
ncbi:hypothetical protein EIN_097000 [Entamoeba invadens IP1]|uniref:Uncharacterized protein n=1 Tax=Entamoeba invadens IP1 TaxID=370355 RepID=A0A0A1U411_ENTIV|nr:hypothetical protein EIN_097000 [Entamoeba invadens IP1]ELP87433.1 hypothetical protein EIN_097000 [Entamoeba invadens IP1]|eukprot:XP_004254204.1 hypothetical protein EIN_097000 [Entamoeba invadens IP1]